MTELDELRGEVADLRARLVALEAASHCSLTSGDRDYLGRLLPVLAGVVGSTVVTIREIRTSDAPALAHVLGAVSPRRLGKLFARAQGIPIAGFVIRRVGVEGHARLWQVLGVCLPGNSATLSRAPLTAR